MENFDFRKLLIQSRRIDEGLLKLSEKLLNPYAIGEGRNAHNRLSELEEKLSTHEEILNNMQFYLKQNLSNLKQRNQQKMEFITNLKSEIKKIEDIAKEAGFSIPIDEFGRLAIKDKSPLRSPCGLIYQETPISIHSLSRSSGGPL